MGGKDKRVGRKRDRQTTTVEQRAWYDMIYRCHKPEHARYKDYGAKGITVCAEWRGPGGRERFVEHMGPKPAGFVLGRKDHAQGYCPDNCLWVSRSAQCRNCSTTAKVRVGDEHVALIDLAEQKGLDGRLVRRRVQVQGWSPDEALSLGPGEKTSKLDPDKVRTIRSLDAQKIPRAQIARVMGVSGAMISDICNGKKWKDVQ